MRRSLWRHLLTFLAIMGPGIITANVDNDAGGIATYSACGAHFGYSMLWLFIPIIIALIIIQEMSSRMGVVTGKGLADLMREQFGLKITFYALVILFVANLGNAIAEFAGIAAAGELFGLPRYILVPIAALFVWWLVVKGTYKSAEKVFLGACVFYLAYIVSGLLAKPDWSAVGTHFIRPEMKFSKTYLFMMIGVVGTTIAPWMQFYQQASVAEKGIKMRHYKYSRMDTILGGFIVNIIAIFIVVTCAATLFKNGVHIETAKDAALALKPLAGKYCFYLFAFGLLNASLFAASILPLSTAYTICEGMGWENGVNKNLREAPQFYSLYTLMIAVSALIILLPRIPLISVMLVSQVANGILLPFVLILMLVLVNNKRIMGKHTNGRFANIITIFVIVLMIVLSVFYLVTLFR
jgi:NRAMP (natural resistance-associated macrophage protein)-like metal ion transporter